jgi:hypothetical protein
MTRKEQLLRLLFLFALSIEKCLHFVCVSPLGDFLLIFLRSKFCEKRQKVNEFYKINRHPLREIQKCNRW